MAINVRNVIDERRISPFQILTFLLCFLAQTMDGYDTVVVGFIAPSLRSHFAISAAQLAPMFSVSLLGLAVGSFSLGVVADKIGRKATLIIAISLFAFFTLVAAWSPSIEVMTALRFLAGLGLGGAMPISFTLASEYCPERQRALIASIVGCGMPFGGVIGGFIAGRLIPAFGWESMMIVGGGAPLILLLAIVLWLPESLRYKMSRNDEAGMRKILAKVARDIDFSSRSLEYTADKVTKSPVAQLLQRGLVGGTLLIWATGFMGMTVIYFMGNWLVILLKDAGMPFAVASIMTSVYLLGNTLSAPVMGWLMDRRNPHFVLMTAFFIGIVGLVMMGFVYADPVLAGVAVFLIGCGSGGTAMSMNSISAGYYPTTARATGVSWNLGWGRVGSIVGASGGGLMVALHFSTQAIFTTVALPLAIGSVTIVGLNYYRARHNRQVALEQQIAGA